MAPDRREEQQLVARLVAGDGRAVTGFLELASDPIWTAVSTVTGGGPDADQAFLAVITALQANGFARLAAFKGRSPLVDFLRLQVREVLGEQAARGFSDDPDRAWSRFERCFRADIRRLVKKIFPAAIPAQQQDLIQDIHLSLIEDNFRRVRGYRADGTFRAYVDRVVTNLLTDLWREDHPRRRLPVKLVAMSALHQAVFKAAAWHGTAQDAGLILMALAGAEPPPSLQDIEQALKDLAPSISAARDGAKPKMSSLDDEIGRAALSIPDPSETPEQRILSQQEQDAREAMVAAMQREASSGADRLPDADRLILALVLDTPGKMASSEIARLMALPVERVYDIRASNKAWMLRRAAEIRKNAGLSV